MDALDHFYIDHPFVS